MLPKLLANAGYDWRNNDRISNSRDPATGQATPVPAGLPRPADLLVHVRSQMYEPSYADYTQGRA